MEIPVQQLIINIILLIWFLLRIMLFMACVLTVFLYSTVPNSDVDLLGQHQRLQIFQEIKMLSTKSLLRSAASWNVLQALNLQ